MFVHDIELVCNHLVRILQWIRDVHPSRLYDLKNQSADLKDFLKSSNYINVNFDEIDLFENSVFLEELIDRPKIGKTFINLIAEGLSPDSGSTFVTALNTQIAQLHLGSIKESSLTVENGLTTFSKLLTSTSVVMRSFNNRIEPLTLSKSSAVYLCLYQIKKNLPLLLTGIEKKCLFVRLYASNCLQACFDRLWNETHQPSDLRCSEFLDLMDSTIGLLDEVTADPAAAECHVDELKKFVDEILSHAMSTAQVANSEIRKKTIIVKSQNILRTFENLKSAIASDDNSCLSLSSQELVNELCALERSVNSAVLCLVLSAMSGVKDPLRALVNFCREKDPVSRDIADLDDLIAEFDVLMDQLMQIGTFAVSCCSNIQKAIEIRSCLASFESLEAELVPSITALYMDTTRTNKTSFGILLDHWFANLNSFRSLLNSIVDPAAFADVVRSELKEAVADLSSSAGAEDNVRTLSRIVKVSKSLLGVVNVVLQEDSLNNVRRLAESFEKCVNGCEQLSAKISINKSYNQDKLTLKMKLLLDTVEDLWESLARHVVESNELSVSTDEPLLDPEMARPPDSDFYKLCPDEGQAETPFTAPCPLTPHIAKGRLLAKEAVLYNTPKRSVVKPLAVLMTPVQRSAVKKKLLSTVKRSRCFRRSPMKPSEENDQSNITDILENLSCLNDTFTTDLTIRRKPVTELQGRRLLDLFAGWDSMLEAEAPSWVPNESAATEEISAIGSSDVPTPEREEDLKRVEDRIKSLKMQTPCGKNDHYVTVISID